MNNKDVIKGMITLGEYEEIRKNEELDEIFKERKSEYEKNQLKKKIENIEKLLKEIKDTIDK